MCRFFDDAHFSYVFRARSVKHRINNNKETEWKNKRFSPFSSTSRTSEPVRHASSFKRVSSHLAFTRCVLCDAWNAFKTLTFNTTPTCTELLPAGPLPPSSGRVAPRPLKESKHFRPGLFLGVFVLSWKTWKSPGILKWLFPALEKSWKMCYIHMLI